MIKRLLLLCSLLCLSAALLAGCNASQPEPKIGVAFGVGPAARWPQEIAHMEEYAKTLGVQLEARLNKDETVKPLDADCIELIDSGVDVLIIRPRNISSMGAVLDYAHEHSVEIISYDSLIENAPVDLFVGYDSEHVGQQLGGYLTELVTHGDYILLWGDMNRNVEDMQRGAMKYISPLEGQINILLQSGVPGWSPEEAKKLVKETVAANGNQVAAIMAFNDKLAGACAEAVAELGIETPVVIAGMDAELDAVHRIRNGTQACTAYMDIKALSYAAVDEAVKLAKGETVDSNTEMDNGSGTLVPCYLLARQLVTKDNIDRVLIDSGYYTYEQVYGEVAPAASGT